MRLLLDACYTPELAALLRERDFDVVSALEREDLASAPDAEVFAAAVAEGRGLVTNDAGGFLPLTTRAAQESQDHHGLMLTSDRSMPRSRDTLGLYVRVLETLLQDHPEDSAFQSRIAWLTP